MKTSTLRLAVVLLGVALAVGGCKKIRERSSGSSGATETIAPANPQPDQTGTDAMTQTVDIEDSRSEAEGAALNNTATATTSTTATTATTTTRPPPPTTTTR